ncbi:hypothetical protein [Desulfovibrio gilichinskyi]|uniref:Uncharacterized protein n=1 Tax=Desulfovibrio gilichinskyi TaxID=1519643 RepID=A0A1X7DJY2_9BACT|nr:hypothetical protein [Desulfovibrio gilichinskyi]SMF16811.1 hypothetical protein SAMN06295933_1993 [Desulfovibrio gilichinskyi]
MNKEDVFLWFDPYKCEAFQTEIMGYARWVEERLVPSFGNWNNEFVREAERLAENDRYQYEGGEADIADDAGIFCSQLAEINAYMLGMSIVGLSHLWEKQVICFLNKELKHYKFENEPKVNSYKLAENYFKLFGVDISETKFPALYELRLVANAIKHGEGGSYEKLKRMNSDTLIKLEDRCHPKFSFSRNLDFESNLISGDMSMLRIAIHPTFEHFKKFKEAVYSFWSYKYWVKVGERQYLVEKF